MSKKALKPMTFVQIVAGYGIILVLSCILSFMFRWSYNIVDSIAAVIFLYVIFRFHFIITPITDNLSITQPKKGIIEINMRIGKLKKQINSYSEVNNVKLLRMLEKELFRTLQVLNENYPDSHFRTVTWLIPKKYLPILKKCDFEVQEHQMKRLSEIKVIRTLSKSYKSKAKAKQVFNSNKVYKISWSRVEAEQLLSYSTKRESLLNHNIII